MNELRLNDENTLPTVGFGTYKAEEQQGIDAVKLALQMGYRLLDTAAKYQNEEAVGKGIKASGIAREEIVVTTKVWRGNLGYEQTKNAFEESLRKLDLTYLDLYLIHWPANEKNFGKDWKKVNAETWRAMEELQAQGKVKSIGVSNFWQEHLEALFETAKVIPAVNQIEFHPGYWQKELTAYCKAKGIRVQGWSPLARGTIFEQEQLKSIAEKHQKTVAQVCLRWCLQQDVIPIPKSTTAKRIIANRAIFDFELSAAEMEQINTIPKMGFSGELPNEWPDRVW
ncbi:aldo/keto reductase [Myroides odoratus]|uniref:aldo/keto reductase n=1 Tax=Myroides odoratus TaxID=256 RepID=UPI0039B05B9B